MEFEFLSFTAFCVHSSDGVTTEECGEDDEGEAEDEPGESWNMIMFNEINLFWIECFEFELRGEHGGSVNVSVIFDRDGEVIRGFELIVLRSRTKSHQTERGESIGARF